jgi:hypothetical protein
MNKKKKKKKKWEGEGVYFIMTFLMVGPDLGYQYSTVKPCLGGSYSS